MCGLLQCCNVACAHPLRAVTIICYSPHTHPAACPCACMVEAHAVHRAAGGERFKHWLVIIVAEDWLSEEGAPN